MKKIAITMVAILAMFAGVACGGSGSTESTNTGWNDYEKASFMTGLVGFGLTTDQKVCMLNWVQDHYDSREEADTATDAQVTELIEACRA